MTRIVPVLCLVAGVALQQFASAQSSPADVDLAKGIRQVREGDFDAALMTLDGVVKRLSAQKGQAKELARAYTYLAIAYIGLGQQETAQAKFLEAWRADRSTTLSPRDFPPNIVDFFEQAKRGGEEKDKAEGSPGFPARWKSLASGSTQILRMDGDYLYVETVLPNSQKQAGSFSLVELKKMGGKYVGRVKASAMCRHFGFIAWNGKLKECSVEWPIEITVLTPKRIEGQASGLTPQTKFDCGKCSYSPPLTMQPFTWIPE